ncbi:unnamed protein product [Linum tenue]|uniref:Protein MIZU-KUSSEI 1 n=2 Tax=Linum tenue TaxID=586396 RepID=A0AAV0H630_9ROSI|nr:unnamed protein product [Linum tenue]
MSTRPAPELSSSSKRHHFHWTKKIGTEDDDDDEIPPPTAAKPSAIPTLKHSASSITRDESNARFGGGGIPTPRKKLPAVAVARLRSVLSSFNRNRFGSSSSGLGPRVVGTLFGSRKGHVHFAFQKDPTSPPAFLIELATPISGLVKEMASGLVRIALECDKKQGEDNHRQSAGNSSSAVRLLEEQSWRAYCNGKKCGFAGRKECGAKEWKLLNALEPISMGAGVMPSYGEGERTEIMYMRAKFERIVGSRDSEAFYMLNPDSNGAPELSIYLLRV